MTASNSRLIPPGGSPEQLFSPSEASGYPAGRFSFEDRLRLWLPPDELVEYPSERIPTPVDERGLVVVPELIEQVKELVDPEYQWSSHKSVHHFYWPSAYYPGDSEEDFKLTTFRNLPIHKGELPREFENLLHKTTSPPEVPSLEVMQYRVEAWSVARSLFDSARQYVQWERKAQRRADLVAQNPWIIERNDGEDTFAQEFMADVIGKYFGSFERNMTKLEEVPAEFRFIEPTNSPQKLAKGLGKFMIPRSQKLIPLVQKPTTLKAA